MADTDPTLPQGRRFWSYARILAAPLLLWVLVVIALGEPLQTWLHGEESYDHAALQEWLDEARGYRGTLREMVEDYLTCAGEYAAVATRPTPPDPRKPPEVGRKAREVLASATTKSTSICKPSASRRPNSIPVSCRCFRSFIVCKCAFFCKDRRWPTVGFPLARRFRLNAPITWDSGLPSDASQYQVLEYHLHPYATVYIRYQLHAYNKRQRIEQAHHQRLRQLSAWPWPAPS